MRRARSSSASAYFVKAVDRLGDTARTNAAQNFDDREFAGGNAVVVVNRPLYEARALIGEDETYRVVTGPDVAGATELTASFIDHYARYFLMPPVLPPTRVGSSVTAATDRS